MAPHATDSSVDFVNEFFDPQRKGYDRERYLRALRDPDDTTRPLTDRIEEVGLLDGQPEEVSRPLRDWFALWPPASAVKVVHLLFEALGSRPPRRGSVRRHHPRRPSLALRPKDQPDDPRGGHTRRNLHQR
jgi:hypothetical protein